MVHGNFGRSPHEIFLVVTVLKSVLRGFWGRSADLKNVTTRLNNGASVLVIGSRLGSQISKPDDKHVNARGGSFAIFRGIKLGFKFPVFWQ